MTGWFDHRASEAEHATAHLRNRVPPPGAGAGPRMLAATTSFCWATEPGPREACVELASAALAEGRLLEVDNAFLFVPPVGVLAFAERAEAVTHLEEGLANALRRGSLLAVAGMRLWLGLAGARELLEADQMPEPPAEAARYYYEATLELLVAEHRDEEALDVADVLQRRFGHVGNPATARWRSLRAPLRHRTGDTEGALADLAEELVLAEAWGAPGPIGRVRRIRGELLGDIDELREAVVILAGSTVRLEYGLALRAVGRKLRLDRRPTEAREPLREALAVAAACGADGLVEEIRAELRAAGVRPRTDTLAGPDALTPSERRIAELAAEGLTNRDIAQQLFVTPKTVEVHLSAVYRKLGITSRRGLPSAMAAV
jgi:DNA-binding CsgD family transcriptional regulator